MTHRETVITALRETVRAREAELISLRDEDDCEVHHMPRRVLAEHESAWDEIPGVDELWTDGSHPTVVDLKMIETAMVLPNYEVGPPARLTSTTCRPVPVTPRIQGRQMTRIDVALSLSRVFDRFASVTCRCRRPHSRSRPESPPANRPVTPTSSDSRLATLLNDGVRSLSRQGVFSPRELR